MRLVTGLLSMSLVMGALLSLTPQLVQPGFLTYRVLFAVLVAVPFDGLASVLFAVHDFAVLFAVHDVVVHVFGVVFLMALPFLELCLAN